MWHRAKSKWWAQPCARADACFSHMETKGLSAIFALLSFSADGGGLGRHILRQLFTPALCAFALVMSVCVYHELQLIDSKKHGKEHQRPVFWLEANVFASLIH